jgi:hypothetical protein
MGYIVVSHKDFANYFIVRQDLENALRDKCDTLAWSEAIRKRYISAVGEISGVRLPQKKVFEKLRDLGKEEPKKAEKIDESAIEACTEHLNIPRGLKKEEYTVFIRLAEAISAFYLVTGGRMLKSLRRARHFRFTAIGAEDY